MWPIPSRKLYILAEEAIVPPYLTVGSVCAHVGISLQFLYRFQRRLRENEAEPPSESSQFKKKCDLVYFFIFVCCARHVVLVEKTSSYLLPRITSYIRVYGEYKYLFVCLNTVRPKGTLRSQVDVTKRVL